MVDPTRALQMLEELKKSFLGELPSRIDELENLVLELRNDTSFEDTYKELYRKTHSLKGSGGTYGLAVISAVCHRLEDHLNLVDGKSQRFSEDHRNRWLKHIDVLRLALDLIGKGRDAQAEVEAALEKISAPVFKDAYRVMIVDKSRTTVMFCENALEDFPAQFVVLSDGYAALERLLQERFDLLISGLELDKLNGVALMGAVRLAHGMNRDIKTILITSNANVKVAECAKPDYVVRRGSEMIKDLRSAATHLLEDKSPR